MCFTKTILELIVKNIDISSYMCVVDHIHIY